MRDFFESPMGMLSIGAFAVLILSGCSGQSDLVKEQMGEIEKRLRDVERHNGRASVRLEDLEDRVTILVDRVETNRLAYERRGRANPLPVIVARPGEELTPMPPVTPERRVSRASGALGSDAGIKARIALPKSMEEKASAMGRYKEESFGRDGENVENVVISEQEYLDFVKKHGINDEVEKELPRKPARRAAGVSRARRAKDPVTSETLDVVPIGTGGSQKGVSQSRGAMEIYKSGLALYRAGDYASAMKEFTAYLHKGPSRDYLDNAYYWLGECSFGMGRFKDAINYFNRVITEIPGGNKVPDSMLKASYAYLKMGQGAQAKKILYNLLETYPSTNAAKLATKKLNKLD
jgi:tol-pal system protein YbgF